jgi:hypothetical protein
MQHWKSEWWLFVAAAIIAALALAMFLSGYLY